MQALLVVMILSTSLLWFWILFKRFFAKNNRIEKRMNRYLLGVGNEETEITTPKQPRININLQRTKESVRKRILTKDKTNKVEVLLNRAGIPLKPEEFVLFQWISTALIAGLFNLFTGNLLFLPIGAIIGFILPKVILQKKQKDRLKAFNDQLPEMIAAVVGALRAGFSFPQALKSVSDEAQSPMKEELESVIREMQYGTSMEDALSRLKERMPSDDLDLMIQAIIIQRQVGGNLATVLDKIIETIRDRIKIQGQISTLTAQGRLSGVVIGLLPVILGLILFVIEPDYIGALIGHPIGIILLVVAAISCTIGFFLIRKLTTIEV
ncbi:type II secretion system F family protein [Aquibacillus sediminis]|uniref:type II secretion system F family protein n=1 Tax=Aquibacillus sediminis TaxID=2574734 RepID=UPI001109D52A|nr:type II secretion system F family protein [Aquibacillus sediminis]